jgi:3,4-dihydroxy 2-butanone 4-phosphate synthase/GTP cyclohydrolase II
MFDPVEDIIEAIKRGEMVIITDDENRENEGDLVMAAELVTPDAINFMVTHGRGLVCTPVDQATAKRLNLRKMAETDDHFHTAFTVSLDAKKDVTTGISAGDRARTISTMVDAASSADDFVFPGHIFPLIAKDGGTLVRAGHTEAAVDLAVLAGLKPAGVICEIMNEDGSMSRIPDLDLFRKKHNLKWCSIEELIKYRRKNEVLIACEQTAKLPTRHGEFDISVYSASVDDKEYVALTYGDLGNGENVLVRVHSECLTGDVFGSARCDCGDQLDFAMKKIVEVGRGAIIYLRQEGRGIGLINKIHAYKLQDEGLDTVEANHQLGFKADLREYGIGAQILHDLGVKSVKLLTNNPRKLIGIEGHGIKIVGREPIICEHTPHNKGYLSTKKQKLGHML